MKQFNLLKYYDATWFGPLRPPSGAYKQQNVLTFVTYLHDAIDPLLRALSYKKFYILWHVNPLLSNESLNNGIC
jgi:hypothetical protein